MSYNPQHHYLNNPEDLVNYLEQELLRIADAFNLASFLLEKSYTPPEKVYDGLIVYADGTNWEPVSGQGEGAIHILCRCLA